MKKLILNFLRPYVLQIMKDHLKITEGRNSVLKVAIVDDPPPPPPPPEEPPRTGGGTP